VTPIASNDVAIRLLSHVEDGSVPTTLGARTTFAKIANELFPDDLRVLRHVALALRETGRLSVPRST